MWRGEVERGEMRYILAPGVGEVGVGGPHGEVRVTHNKGNCSDGER